MIIKKIKAGLVGLLIAVPVLLPMFLLSFKSDCQHIYTTVEQKEVKIKYPPSMKLAIFEPQKTGKHEGQEIVCVKCFNITKQIMDFGDGYKQLPE